MPDGDDVGAERQRPVRLIEKVDRRLGLDRKAERPALLHDRFVQEVVGLVQAHRHAEHLLRAFDAGNVIQVRVGQQDVAGLQLVPGDRLQQRLDFVAGIDQHAFPCLFAADDVAVLVERRDGARFQDHREPSPRPFSHYWSRETCRRLHEKPGSMEACSRLAKNDC
jgi:hypothetical protein